MKIIINKCYGGFGFSPAAIRRINELKGRPCFFFKRGENIRELVPYDIEDGQRRPLLWNAFDVADVTGFSFDEGWSSWSEEKRRAHNANYQQHDVKYDESYRTDPIAIQVVEELGKDASDTCAQLDVIEIPDGIEWEIDEYDGIESVEEKHASWS